MLSLENFDLTQTFQIDTLDVRGRLVRLGPALNAVLEAHDYPKAVAEMLAETLTLGAVLASSLKFDGLFTLQVQSDGPISLIVADLTSGGEMRGYARYDAARVAQASAQDGAKVPRLLGAGHLAFTVDQGPHTERYQGIVALEGATLAACVQSYFRVSEQLETVIFLGTEQTSQGWKSGALMVQRMPEKTILDEAEGEENWRRAVVLLSSLKCSELLDASLKPDQVLYRLYHDDGVRAYKPNPLVHRCRCSREKVATTLKSFARAEIIDDDGHSHVTCDFCSKTYAFSPPDLDDLFGAPDK